MMRPGSEMAEGRLVITTIEGPRMCNAWHARTAASSESISIPVSRLLRQRGEERERQREMKEKKIERKNRRKKEHRKRESERERKTQR